MASPQTEEGYTRIANELVEAFARLSLNGEAYKVLWTIIRKTYGYQKREDWISLSQFSESTGLPKRSIQRAIFRLTSEHMVIRRSNGRGVIFSINKDYETWGGVETDTGVEIAYGGVSKLRTKRVSKLRNTKEIKKTNKRNSMGKFKEYNENKHFEEPSFDVDSENDSRSKEQKGISWDVLLWAEKDMGRKFSRRIPNLAAINRISKSGKSEQEIKDKWKEMKKNSFYQKVGIDFQKMEKEFDAFKPKEEKKNELKNKYANL